MDIKQIIFGDRNTSIAHLSFSEDYHFYRSGASCYLYADMIIAFVRSKEFHALLAILNMRITKILYGILQKKLKTG